MNQNAQNPDFIREIEAIRDKYDVTNEDVSQAFLDAIRSDSEKKILEKAAQNKKYVGRCFTSLVKPYHEMFPQMKRFYKVLSEQSTNEYRVSVLHFIEHPLYWFKYADFLTMRRVNCYFGEFEFESFKVEDKLAATFNDMDEISQEEFDNAAMLYVRELLNMPWRANHYRFGGKLPGDEGWIQN